nr:phosphoribosylamine--glycine ligase [Chloroflexia bacterium]
MSQNVLVIGSGAREHAMVWKLAQGSRIGTLFCAPGNPGAAEVAQNLDIGVNDVEGIWSAIESNNID